MSWAGGLALAGLAGALIAPPLAAQAVIVRATGPDAARFPVSQVLAKGSAVDLRRGSMLGLIDKAGAWELRGAVKTRIGKRPVETSSRLQLLQELVKKRKRIKRLAAVAALSGPAEAAGAARAQPRTGALRRAPPAAAAAAPPSAAQPTRSAAMPGGQAAQIDTAWWQYPLGESGTFCLVPGEPFELVRRSGPEQDVTFREEPGGRTLSFRFGAEAEIAHAAPADIPLADGRIYTVEADGGTKASVRFVPIAAPADSLALARSLAASGCTRQIEALSSETAIAQAEAIPARP